MKKTWFQWLEVLVIPVAIAFAGGAVAIATSLAQIKSAETIADQQADQGAANSERDRDIAITGALADLVKNGSGCDVSDLAKSLIGKATPVHSESLNLIWKARCPKDSLADVVQLAKENEIRDLIQELAGENRRVARNSLGEKVLSDPDLTAKLLKDFVLDQKSSYRTQLGVLVALNYAGYREGRDASFDDVIEGIRRGENAEDSTVAKLIVEIGNG